MLGILRYLAYQLRLRYGSFALKARLEHPANITLWTYNFFQTTNQSLGTYAI